MNADFDNYSEQIESMSNRLGEAGGSPMKVALTADLEELKAIADGITPEQYRSNIEREKQEKSMSEQEALEEAAYYEKLENQNPAPYARGFYKKEKREEKDR